MPGPLYKIDPKELYLSECSSCNDINENYLDMDPFKAFEILKSKTQNGEMVLEKGSCPLEDLQHHFDIEDMYVLEFYFRCKCNLTYYAGFCIRGTPKLKIL